MTVYLLISILAAIIPSFALLYYFYKNDRHPEPIRTLLTTFVLGVISTVGVFVVVRPAVDLVYAVSSPYLQGLLHALALAAVPEETLKMVVVMGYSMKSAAFDEPMDGLVYGVTASLGFATLENILYVSQGGIYTAFVRAFTAVPTHAALGVIMGYFLSRFHFRQERKALVYAWLIPVAFHAAYNFPLMTARTLYIINDQTYGIIQILLIVAAAVVIRLILGYALKLFREVRRNQNSTADREQMAMIAEGLQKSWFDKEAPDSKADPE
ncbi:MAG: PrsW family intramembrane metalloprotease [Chitinivibrionales bacterium]